MKEKLQALKNLHLLPVSGKVSLGVSVIAAIGSLGFMLNAGRQTPFFLLVLFVGWISAPFLVLWFGYIFLTPWSSAARILLHSLMWVLGAVSLTCYSGAMDYPGMKPAFMFVMVPIISFLLTVLIMWIARRLSRKMR